MVSMDDDANLNLNPEGIEFMSVVTFFASENYNMDEICVLRVCVTKEAHDKNELIIK
jgi:hypothetical protein